MAKKGGSRGFSLVEILIVIGIIGILITAGIVLINPPKQIAKSNDAKRKSDIRLIQGALEQFLADNGAYPKFYIQSSGTYTYGWARARNLAFDKNPSTLANTDIDYIKEFPLGPNVKSTDSCTNNNYKGYVFASDQNNPNIYTLYTNLENTSDKDATTPKERPKVCPGYGDTTRLLPESFAPCSADNINANWTVGSCPGTYNYWVNSP